MGFWLADRRIVSCPSPSRRIVYLSIAYTAAAATSAAAAAAAHSFPHTLSIMSDSPSSSGASPTMSSGELTGRIISSAVLILMSALFSGLTLGLAGLDVNQLDIMKQAGTPSQRANAAKIQPIRAQGNLLLCTLVLGNVAVTSLSSIVLAELTSGYVGVAISTILITIFGEIVPQAVCARYALEIGARAVPIVKFFIILFYPVTKPIALTLDYFLGAEIGNTYSRAAFMQLVAMQVGSNLFNQTEANIIGGALSFREKLVSEVLTPVSRMFSVSASDKLDNELMDRIFRTGYSRVPVWDDAKLHVVGMLYAKDLVLVTPEQRQPVAAVVHFFGRTNVNMVDDCDTLETALKMFIATRQHIAVVRTVVDVEGHDPEYRICGLVTLEDILEEIIGQELRDEYEAGSSHHREVAGMMHIVDTEASVTASVLLAAASKPDLSPAEIRAISAHLLTNVPTFAACRVSFTDVETLVAKSRVFVLVARSGGSGPDAGTLFKKGEVASGAALVLRGHVEMEGSDLPASGAWEIILEEALSGTNVIIPSGDIRAQTDATVLLILRSDLEAIAKNALPTKSLPSTSTPVVSPTRAGGSTPVSPARFGGVGGATTALLATSTTTSTTATAATTTTSTTTPQHVLSLSLRDESIRGLSARSISNAAPVSPNLQPTPAAPDQISISMIALGGAAQKGG